MMLYELIATLEKEDPEKVIHFGFHNPHSYRGYYEDLAFEPCKNIEIKHMLRDAKFALGHTFTGWKGGEFKMDQYSNCWLANVGESGETIGDLLLYLMLNWKDE